MRSSVYIVAHCLRTHLAAGCIAAPIQCRCSKALMQSERSACCAGRDKKQPGVAQPAEGAAGEEAQVSSKPVEWPTVPPGSKRQRSRLHQTPGSAPAGATPEELSPHPVCAAGWRLCI